MYIPFANKVLQDIIFVNDLWVRIFAILFSQSLTRLPEDFANHVYCHGSSQHAALGELACLPSNLSCYWCFRAILLTGCRHVFILSLNLVEFGRYCSMCTLFCLSVQFWHGPKHMFMSMIFHANN